MPAGTTAPATAPETAVIRAKVRLPPTPEDRIPRPRVERHLAELIEHHRTVVVAATAGAGKTTAVAAAVQQLGRPVAWLALDWTDAAPGRLVRYLEAALATQLRELDGVASRALAARLPHAKAAGLLAEAADAPIVLVVDELERLGDAEPAWAVIRALVRYAPPALRIVLVSRRDVPAALLTADPGHVASLHEEALAFTPEEARAALARRGATSVDAEAAVAATGGWVTGVLFEAWRVGEHVAGTGGETDPLHGYLAAHILGQLPDADCSFLIGTAVLDAVTAPRAIALGHADAAERLASLRAARLPAVWEDGGRTLRCHDRFREYLLDMLEERGADTVRRVRLAHGRLLVAEGRDEDAVEALLVAATAREALAPAERAIFAVLDRLDIEVAERWLAALRPVAPPTGPLVLAELMLALARDDPARGAALGDALGRDARDALATAMPDVLVLLGYCYVHVGRIDDAEALTRVLPPGHERDALCYFLAICGFDPPPPRPPLTGGAGDALVVSVDFGYARLADMLAEPTLGWARAWSQPWLLSALSLTGRTQQALELYEEVRAHGPTSVALDVVVGPLVLIHAGRRDEALGALARGRRAARRGGSVVFELLADLSEAELRLRLDGDPDTALAVLDRLEARPVARRLGYVADVLDTWYGLALLLEGRDAAARERLRRAVDMMRRSRRLIQLPSAAVYLAEAEWRLGDEEAADAAADVALEAAQYHGSNHLLLCALAQFPAVVSRRLDAEPAADSPWHELGRALLAQDVTVPAPVGGAVQLQEFGSPAILVDGAPARPRIAKTYELLAFLATRPEHCASREELLAALFEGRTDDSARAYLRQAIRWLRQVLPAGGVHSEGGEVRLDDDVRLLAESARFETALAEAARLHGAERLAATNAALELAEGGQYLAGVTSDWAEQRRRQLAELATDARYQAAEDAFAEDRLEEARRYAEQVLESDPYREAAHRLTMRLTAALGDDDGVIRAFQRCERALAEVGAAPARTTRDLLDQLRR